MSQDYCDKNKPFYVTTTSDAKVHVLYSGKTDGGTLVTAHRYFDGSSWSSYVKSDFSFYQNTATFRGNANDLYAVYLHPVEYGVVYIEVYDAAPTAPTGLSGSVSSNHPVLSWTGTPEADVYSNTTNGYEIYRRDWSGRTELVRDWTKIAQVSGTTTTYTDTEIWYNQSGNDKVDYKIRAVDAGGQASSYSSIIWFGCELPKPVVGGLPAAYALGTYPNPFNPTTQLRYDLPASGDVSLQILDVLGREVKTLQAGHSEAGSYTVAWNAADQATGVYFARLTVTNPLGKMVYTATAKLLLTR